jgi:nucleoid DNA-binding protein
MAAAKAPGAVKEKYSKSQILADLAEASTLTKKEVGTVLEELSKLIERHLGKKGVGEFTLPGILKITTVHKKAQKARKGINPFTKEEVMFKAKPARTVVKVRPLKKLKEMVE